METEFIEGKSIVPTPMMSEEERLKVIDIFRRALARKGMVIISERRGRNPVFDKKGERTTFKVTFRPQQN